MIQNESYVFKTQDVMFTNDIFLCRCFYREMFFPVLVLRMRNERSREKPRYHTMHTFTWMTQHVPKHYVLYIYIYIGLFEVFASRERIFTSIYIRAEDREKYLYLREYIL